MKDEESFMLDDPAKLKALAHPLRRLMLRHLNVHGPATSTTLGEVLNAKTGTTSYHLRLLEKCGFIEEIPERSTGRERWWRKAAPRTCGSRRPTGSPPRTVPRSPSSIGSAWTRIVSCSSASPRPTCAIPSGPGARAASAG
ncbi:ArsR/SmtB family transcription factor [Streptosporangium lutulentum]